LYAEHTRRRRKSSTRPDVGGRLQIGTMAGFVSECMAGFVLEFIAGFVESPESEGLAKPYLCLAAARSSGSAFCPASRQPSHTLKRRWPAGAAHASGDRDVTASIAIADNNARRGGQRYDSGCGPWRAGDCEQWLLARLRLTYDAFVVESRRHQSADVPTTAKNYSAELPHAPRRHYLEAS
jgi:hypothetical protein